MLRHARYVRVRTNPRQPVVEIVLQLIGQTGETSVEGGVEGLARLRLVCWVEALFESVLDFQVVVHGHCAAHPDLSFAEDARRGIRGCVVDEPAAWIKHLAGLSVRVGEEDALDSSP